MIFPIQNCYFPWLIVVLCWFVRGYLHFRILTLPLIDELLNWTWWFSRCCSLPMYGCLETRPPNLNRRNHKDIWGWNQRKLVGICWTDILWCDRYCESVDAWELALFGPRDLSFCMTGSHCSPLVTNQISRTFESSRSAINHDQKLKKYAPQWLSTGQIFTCRFLQKNHRIHNSSRTCLWEVPRWIPIKHGPGCRRWFCHFPKW